MQIKRDEFEMKELEITSERAEIERIGVFLKENLKGLNLSDEAFYIIELSLAEICINIINYAYPEKKGKIFLKLWKENRKIFVEIRDEGVPFDPRETKTPDLEKMIRKKEKGGLGIFLCRKLMDGFEYRRENNQNILTMYKRVEETGTPE